MTCRHVCHMVALSSCPLQRRSRCHHVCTAATDNQRPLLLPWHFVHPLDWCHCIQFSAAVTSKCHLKLHRMICTAKLQNAPESTTDCLHSLTLDWRWHILCKTSQNNTETKLDNNTWTLERASRQHSNPQQFLYRTLVAGLTCLNTASVS